MRFPRLRLAPGALASGLAALVLAAASPLAAQSESAAASAAAAHAIFRNALEFGRPLDADSADDLLLVKRTYALSYNCSRGGANWVSWNLNRTQFGDIDRASRFRADATLPDGCRRIRHEDYSGTGFSRGHMVRSEERTATRDDNLETFLLTNVLPQRQDLNAGPWLKLEMHLQRMAQDSLHEIYVIAGGIGDRGTLSGKGLVVIPTHTYKIAVLLPEGRGLADVTGTAAVRVIAVLMPNETGVARCPWQHYRVTIDELEHLTGYDFLALLPDEVENAVEASTEASVPAGPECL